MKTTEKGQSIIIECTKEELIGLEILLEKLSKEEKGNPEYVLSNAISLIRAKLYSNIKFKINEEQV